MGRRTREEENSIESLRTKSLIFLNQNFFKFKEATKIRIAIDILKITQKTEPIMVDQSVHHHHTTIQKLHHDIDPKNRLTEELLSQVEVEANGHTNRNGSSPILPDVFRVD